MPLTELHRLPEDHPEIETMLELRGIEQTWQHDSTNPPTREYFRRMR
jgi:hypothetical protein